jgi:hypothetical protein
MEYFSETACRKRLQGNPYVDSLVQRKLSPATLGADIARVSEDRDPFVSRLHKVRNEALAHIEPNPIRLGSASPLQGLGVKDVETLLRRARTILSRYSLIYRASLLSSTIVGSDDYIHTLEYVRRGMKALHAQHKEEMRRITSTGKR